MLSIKLIFVVFCVLCARCKSFTRSEQADDGAAYIAYTGNPGIYDSTSEYDSTADGPTGDLPGPWLRQDCFQAANGALELLEPACAVEVAGADAAISAPNPLDGVYRVAGCRDGSPLYLGQRYALDGGATYLWRSNEERVWVLGVSTPAVAERGTGPGFAPLLLLDSDSARPASGLGRPPKTGDNDAQAPGAPVTIQCVEAGEPDDPAEMLMDAFDDVYTEYLDADAVYTDALGTAADLAEEFDGSEYFALDDGLGLYGGAYEEVVDSDGDAAALVVDSAGAGDEAALWARSADQLLPESARVYSRKVWAGSRDM